MSNNRMEIFSCNSCGVVLDMLKLKWKEVIYTDEDEDERFDRSYVKCPVCANKMTEDDIGRIVGISKLARVLK